MVSNSLFPHFTSKELWQLESVYGIVNLSKQIRFDTFEHMFVILFKGGDAVILNTEEETIAYLKTLLKLTPVVI